MGKLGLGEDYSIRPAVPGDRPGIVELLRGALGESLLPKSEEIWRWKHEENPFGPSPCLVAESASGALVGVRALMRWQWTAGGRRWLAVRAVDTATDPAWQGRGIFKRLTTELIGSLSREAVPLVFNTPNRQSLPGYLRMGWAVVGRPAVWVTPAVRPWRRAHRDQEPVRDIPDELAALLLDTPGGRLRTARSLSYLRWRYCQPPHVAYHLEVDPSAAPKAAVIWRRRTRHGLREILVCEVLHEPTPGGMMSARGLLRGLASRGLGHYLLGLAPAWSWSGAAFAASGFARIPSAGPLVTVRRLRDGLPFDPHNRRAWQWSAGDLELM